MAIMSNANSSIITNDRRLDINNNDNNNLEKSTNISFLLEFEIMAAYFSGLNTSSSLVHACWGCLNAFQPKSHQEDDRSIHILHLHINSNKLIRVC